MGEWHTKAQEIASNPADLAPNDSDPRQYLEDIEGGDAMAWVKAKNEGTLARLSSDPRFGEFERQAFNILTAPDRIANPSFVHGNKVDNFWQDSKHVRGTWRRCDWASYAKGSPKWETILDIDALAAKEGRNWIYKGRKNFRPHNDICLIALSDGGKDAVFYREFDIKKKTFVEGGFALPESKQSVSWVDKDTLYVTREWNPGEVTTSGYPYITKRLVRGQSLDQATEVFRGEVTDVSASLYVLRDISGRYVMDIARRSPSCFETLTSFMTPEGPVTLPLPLTSSFAAYCKKQSVFRLKDDWVSAKGTQFKSGSVISFNLSKVLKAPNALEPDLIFVPDVTEAVEDIVITKNHLVLGLLSNVTGRLISYAYTSGQWKAKALDLPQNATLSLSSVNDRSDKMFVYATGFLQPSTLYRVDAKSGEIETIRQALERFDAKDLRVQQFFATSKDGTKIPYFLVAHKDRKADGQTPVLIYAYGGFEISMLPSYSGVLGKLWLQRGGAYVVANIRGGGEFGPEWHKAGLKTQRQRIYDDFQAVALDLIDKKITQPRHLGITGVSNGGLLMGVMFTQAPDLWNAVVIKVPLLDMVRYAELSAGASWQGEYGDPKDAQEGAFLRIISPYHNLKPGIAYPEPLIETSTKDDRVHPGHARKFAALLDDMGLPNHYYENTEGGHGGVANEKQAAHRFALEFTYLAQRLM
jgi:prolyl oligopeptidase